MMDILRLSCGLALNPSDNLTGVEQIRQMVRELYMSARRRVRAPLRGDVMDVKICVSKIRMS